MIRSLKRRIPHRLLHAVDQQLLSSSKSSRCIFPQPLGKHAKKLSSESSRGGSPLPLAHPGPVVTFLSPNPQYSRSAVSFLNRILQLPHLDLTCTLDDKSETDTLNKLSFGDSNGMKWDSVACMCPTSGTILHFLSFAKEGRGHNDVDSSHSLVSIQGGTQPAVYPDQTSECTAETWVDVLRQSRGRLADEMKSRQFFQSTLESRLRGTLINMMNSMGRQPSPSWLLAKLPGTTSYQPVLLDLRQFELSVNKDANTFGEMQIRSDFKIRELAIPHFPEMSALQKQLSSSELIRPIPGLYQYSQIRVASNGDTSKDGLILRPLPSAAEDFRLPPPSLVCQCNSLSEIQELVENKLGGTTTKIGWRGDGHNGSLIVHHPSVRGLELRLVETADDHGEWVLNSFFDESQEALLAASLYDLQSSHVISEGTDGKDKENSREVDPKVLKADCWVETRANMKSPRPFFSKPNSLLKRILHKNKVAKPPDLPFE